MTEGKLLKSREGKHQEGTKEVTEEWMPDTDRERLTHKRKVDTTLKGRKAETMRWSLPRRRANSTTT